MKGMNKIRIHAIVFTMHLQIQREYNVIKTVFTMHLQLQREYNVVKNLNEKNIMYLSEPETVEVKNYDHLTISEQEPPTGPPSVCLVL